MPARRDRDECAARGGARGFVAGSAAVTPPVAATLDRCGQLLARGMVRPYAEVNPVPAKD